MGGLKSKRRARRLQYLVTGACTLLAAVGISSCGGGGAGGESAAPGAASALAPQAILPIAPEPLATHLPEIAIENVDGKAGRLILSEVATNYYSNDVAWFEVHNPSGVAVSLSRYTLRSSHIDPASGVSSMTPMEFALPAATVPARGYLVIAANNSGRLHDNAQMVYVKNGGAVPYWNSGGSIELLAEGVTVDFVRFGGSTAAPAIVSEWLGNGVAALPSGANEHGKSIVRLHAAGMLDNNRAEDWTLVNFATPAGINDVPSGAVDSDRDGIPDSAKQAGGSYGGLDLYAMGARRGQRDIFLEIDYMNGSDIATTPRREALEKMAGIFAANGIALHMDAGGLYAGGFDPAQFNLGGGNSVDFARCVELDTLGSSTGPAGDCASFQQIKNANFDVRRRLMFHYALFANSLKSDGGSGPSGIAELHGNDVIVTLGGYNFSTASESGRNMLVNMQASTLMHEFGHNLGLRHGGNEDSNYKPNHYSVMNYMYQFAGLSDTPDSAHAAERYYLAHSLKGITFCGLSENSPCTAAFRMDYSNGAGAPLDEAWLSEAANIGYGSVDGAYADWDNNDAPTATTFGRNINPLDGYGRSVLRDYDEWGNLALPFARGYSGSSTGREWKTQAKVVRPNPMSLSHPHRNVEEPALPADLHEAIRNLRDRRGGKGKTGRE